MPKIEEFRDWAEQFDTIYDLHIEEFVDSVPEDLDLREMKILFSKKHRLVPEKKQGDFLGATCFLIFLAFIAPYFEPIFYYLGNALTIKIPGSWVLFYRFSLFLILHIGVYFIVFVILSRLFLYASNKHD